MRGGSPTSNTWSQILIDAAKDMGGFDLTNIAALAGTNITFSATLASVGDARTIDAPNTDDNSIVIRARDNGVGRVEVARIQGAADPFMQLTLPPVITPHAVPATPVAGHLYHSSVDHKVRSYDGGEFDELFRGLIIRKTGDQTVNNSIARVNDNDLFLPMLANQVWHFKLLPLQSSTANAGVTGEFTTPAGATIFYFYWGANYTGVWTGFSSTAVPLFNMKGNAADTITLILEGIVINGANAGNLQFKWAQTVAEATNTIMRTNSLLIANRIL